MADKLPPLPPGFAVQEAANVPPLPPGFALEQAPPLPPGFKLQGPDDGLTLKRAGQVALNAGNEAVAGVPDMFLNAPTNLWNLVKAGGGTIAGLAGKPEWMPELTPNPDLVRKGFKSARFIREEDAPQTPAERRIAALTGGAVAGLVSPAKSIPQIAAGALTGALGGEAANETKELTGSDAAAIAAGMATPWAANKAGQFGRERVAAANELKSQKQPIIDTNRAVREAGYTIPPAMSNPSIVNRLLESFGGKTATAQESSLGNTDVTAKLIRGELRAPPAMGITDDALDALSHQRAQPYRDVAAMPGLPAQLVVNNPNTRFPQRYMGPTPPTPAEMLKDLNQARIDSKDHWREYQRQGSVAARDRYQNATSRAQQLEADIENVALTRGRPDLVDQLRAARQDIAKIHDVGRALNTDRGEISAIDLANAKARGVPLTGNLEVAAKMGSAYEKAVKPPEVVGSPAVNNLVAGLSAATGAGIGALGGGPVGSMLGGAIGALGVPLAQMGVRKMLLSKPYQSLMGDPNYNASSINRLLAQYPEASKQQMIARSLMLANILRGEDQ